MKISAAVIAQNEEKYIYRLLCNVYDYVDEIIIVDGGSKDNTVDIATTFSKKVKVVYREFDLDFSKQRNFALENCSGDWIICPDCDELFCGGFLEGIKEFVKNDNCNVYNVMRHTVIDSILVGEECQPRMLRKGVLWNGKVHEGVVESKDKIIELDCMQCMYHLHTWNRQHYNNKLYSNIINNVKERPEHIVGEVDGKEIEIERDSNFTENSEWKDGWRRIKNLDEVHHRKEKSNNDNI